ncbi:hypothetical protein E8E12_006380 [Didymella heteroderae]|uniref:Cytosolic endo-beta-N-acetylglucosaminidase TIM barrel domain-containing protein n=1 Tax=Didymella heteroderae TaxID=1769908 RepID=A0A9P5BYX0_9PLEO|nr:hypothetical protein E8E12_006380 [Didymella heteroderae]
MAYLLGWKDILRPIRDGYRHLFPSPDTGPTPEERRKQRALDSLKGFTYFDTFEQLETWIDADSDPLQRASTPLLLRSCKTDGDLDKAMVLLCHDYAGNYHDYEGTTSIGLDDEKYACERLQYDALTTFNKVSYQNALNDRNLPFVKACGSVLTNYCWKEDDAEASLSQALQAGLPPYQIYFGIDVWAQNKANLAHPRVTYPEYGGGGTNTGVAVAKLAELGLSAGIFAPAWTFEHFPGHGRDMEATIWDGKNLPDDTGCSCGDCSKRHQPNKTSPIASVAKEYNAGSETFFFTDFSRAFSSHSDEEEDILYGGSPLHAQLGSQSILPLRTESIDLLSPLRHKTESVAGRSQLVIEARNLPPSVVKRDLSPTDNSWAIPLYRLDMPIDGSLRLRISYRDLSKIPQGVSFYLKASCQATKEEARRTGYPIGYSHKLYNLTRYDYLKIDHLLDVELKIDDQYIPANLRLEELGFWSQATTDKRLAEIDYICIQPVASYPTPSRPFTYRGSCFQDISSCNSSPDIPPHHALFGIRKETRGEGDTQHVRLCWSHSSSEPVQGMPYSEIIGAFSHFVVEVDDLSLGRAYAAEHVIPASFVEDLTGREVAVRVHGIGYDGQELAGASLLVQF